MKQNIGIEGAYSGGCPWRMRIPWRVRQTIIIAAALLFPISPGQGQTQPDQEPKDTATLMREMLQSSQAENETLRHRLEALEAQQQAMMEMLERTETEEGGNEDEGDISHELFAELQAQIDDLNSSLETMPTIAGYLDVEYFDDDKGGSPGEFRQHHFSLHLSHEYESIRLFAEAEWEYGAKFEGDGGTALEEARGEVILEQAWGEWVIGDPFTLRAGLILTPGYWNINHYPHHVLSTRRPGMVRKVFAESFVGVMGYGAKYWDELGLHYEAWVSNGESPFFTKNDDNENKSIGGRLVLDLPGDWFDSFQLGVRGSTESPVGGGDTDIWGLETQIRRGPFEFLAEYAARNGVQDRDGIYLQPSWRFNEHWIVFYRYDNLDITGGDEITEHTVGFNYDLQTNTKFKLEVFHSKHRIGENFTGVAASFALGF